MFGDLLDGVAGCLRRYAPASLALGIAVALLTSCGLSAPCLALGVVLAGIVLGIQEANRERGMEHKR